MVTEAYEHLTDAKIALQHAVENLARIAVDSVSGTYDFTSEYRKKIREIFYKLVELREELNNQ
jgi:hypothetical protein